MGKYDALERFFANLDGDDVTLGFDEIVRVLGTPLPSSASKYASWWSSAQYYAVWARHGWRASPDLARYRVRFRRVRAAARSNPRADQAPDVARWFGGDRRLLLLGCVKTKRASPAPAKDLYTSALWQKRRTYAEASGQSWRILSAEHGLIQPDMVIDPYDRHLGSQTPGYQRAWSRRVADAVLDELRRLDLTAVEFHASTPYVRGVLPILESAGVTVAWPFEGLRQGEHLAWYNESSPGCPEDAGNSTIGDLGLEWPTLQSVERIGAFDYRWPDVTERFDYGWEGRVDFRGDSFRFRHAVGRRPVYGTERIHTVTFLEGAPVVEGVAGDDFFSSQSLLSLIKRPDGSMVRSSDELPPGYDRFLVVGHRSEIDAPYSRSGLTVKIRTDDITAWVAHALLRRESQRGRRLAAPQATKARPPDLVAEDVLALEPSKEPLDLDQKRSIAARLLEFGKTLSESTPTPGDIAFTTSREANQMLREDPFAFLVAVIFDYQITAERAWAAPYLLKQRLDHFDPHRMVAEPDRVARAVAERPSLHRYVERVPAFVVEAARIVIEQYEGDAARIWSDEPTAAVLQDRLRQFPGISQKKAAMAVETLERDLGVPIREMSGSDIAFDVHIRRVFIRTGLAEVDDPDHMIAIARRTHPDRPGALDAPAWVIGRTWCHPRDPDCRPCVLDDACAHRIDEGSRVQGA